MRLSTAVLLACAGVLLCALQPTLAMPYVFQPMSGAGGSGTQVIVDELEEETLQVKQRVELPVVDGGSIRDEQGAEDMVLEEDMEVDVEVDESSPSPAPSCSCKLRKCWKSCTRRGYNWGICLCKKCHCYY
ncbi:uncharacterized protein LOC113210183 [Frankliniella occidentalis]|uniref:Uncharacterized protein LOC113210183 n=1 Tax=Frankliniella occidentalis TaxID=133901 RepID=A0A6J1SSL3_FRAOC|nr:uncharacterized protein LOC113210183 [Frankliniella occidentalis]